MVCNNHDDCNSALIIAWLSVVCKPHSNHRDVKNMGGVDLRTDETLFGIICAQSE